MLHQFSTHHVTLLQQESCMLMLQQVKYYLIFQKRNLQNVEEKYHLPDQRLRATAVLKIY